MPINKHYSDQNGNQYCTARPPRLPGQVQITIRTKHYTYRTEETYVPPPRKRLRPPRLPGHTSVKTTQIYTYVLNRGW
ncbi:MAG: hypothetical protein FJY97_00195 [candidate division Zixibacteria bacterium]|nr:hypothetical protein [candidate division Zixibacteria bacterium]